MKSVPIPIIRYDEATARDAFDAYAALVSREAAEPTLLANRQWRAIRDFAFANFQRAFEAPQ